MPSATLSPQLTRILEIAAICLLVFTIGFGLLYQLEGWKLEGGSLILVVALIINYVNLLRSQLAQASDRIDQLERRLAEPPSGLNMRAN